MRALHGHMLSHCDPLFLVIQQTPSSTTHAYVARSQGSTYVRFSKTHGIDIVGNINLAKAQIPGVSE
jgi:hypothetical protein